MPRFVARLLLLLVAFVLSPACNCSGCDPGPQAGLGLIVVDGRVRSCDVVVSSSSVEVPAVSFSDAVIGESMPKAPKLAVSFAAKEDATLESSEIARFVYARTGGTATLVNVQCFDGRGARVEGFPVRLQS